MPYYVAAWLANIFFGFGSVASKLSSKHQLSNPWLLNFILGVFITVCTIPIAVVAGIHMPTHWGALWLTGVSSMISGTLYVLAMYKLDISTLSPLYSLKIVFNIIIGLLFFSERLTLEQMTFVFLVFIAGLFVGIDEKQSIRSFFRPVILLALSAVFSSTLFNATIKYALQYEGFWEVNLWSNVFAMILSLITVPLFWKDLRKTHVRQYSGTVISALVYTIALALANVAYAVNIGLSSAILAVPMSMIMAILFSIIKPELLEKHTMKVYAIRFTAAAVMFWAAVRLSV